MVYAISTAAANLYRQKVPRQTRNSGNPKTAKLASKIIPERNYLKKDFETLAVETHTSAYAFNIAMFIRLCVPSCIVHLRLEKWAWNVISDYLKKISDS